MQRRNFIKLCAATCAVSAHPAFSAENLKPRFYARSRLVNELGQPIKAAGLVAGRNYIFHYPFQSTPCFLLDLGKTTGRDVELKTESGAAYRWTGGVGPRRSIVGYSAICAHRMSYPTPQISFISYREHSQSGTAKQNTIQCCSEHSEYDPAAGGKVLAGPAPQPLAAILLEHDPKSDALYATGTLGGEMFNAFFAKYEFRLAIDYGTSTPRREVAAQTIVKELTQFCKQQVRC